MARITTSPTTAYDFESITVSSAAIGCTGTKIKVVTQLGAGNDGGDVGVPAQGYNRFAEQAFVTVETNTIRYRLDGTNPTASVGHIATDGEIIELEGYNNIANFRAIRKDAASATLRVTYFRRD